MYFNTLVLSGGSLKGMALLGCFKYLEERDLLSDVHMLIGTSFGSIIAYLYVLGYTSFEMTSLLKTCLENYPKNPMTADCLFNAICNLGIDNGEYIYTMLSEALYNKLHVKDITFIDLAKKTGKDLIVSAVNVTQCTTRYFNMDDSPTLSVLQAVRMSISIPLIFEPVMFNGDMYVDGGLFDNLPINYIQYKKDTKGNMSLKDVLAISIVQREPTDNPVIYKELKKENTKPDFMSFIRIILNAMVTKLNDRQPNPDKFKVVTVTIHDTALLDEYSLKDSAFLLLENLVNTWVHRGYTSMIEQLTR